MESARFLFLMLCVSQGQSELSVHQEDHVPPDLPVLWDELKGLKELVLRLKATEVEQCQARRSMESRLRDREVEAEQQRRSLDGLEEVLGDMKVRTEADRKLLMELRRKVQEVEEQSEGEKYFTLKNQRWVVRRP